MPTQVRILHLPHCTCHPAKGPLTRTFAGRRPFVVVRRSPTRDGCLWASRENTEGSLAPPQAEGRDTPPAALVRGVAVCRFAFRSGAVPRWPTRGTAQLVKQCPPRDPEGPPGKASAAWRRCSSGRPHKLPRHDRGRRRLLDHAYDAAARVADLGYDGTSDLTVSDVIPTGELESWCPAERSVDTTRRLGRLGRWPDVAGPRPPDRRYHGPSL